jgi:hypothetical protein
MHFFDYLDKRIKLYADQLKNEALKKVKIEKELENYQ